MLLSYKYLKYRYTISKIKWRYFMANNNKTLKPGNQVENDTKLYVKDAKGKTLSEINVPAGHRVPPTRIEEAESYSTKK